MFGKLLSAVATALGGGKYRVALDRRPDGFVLQVYQGKNAMPLSKVAAKVERLAPFVRLPSRPDGSVVLPPGLLTETKSILQVLAEDGLEVLISPNVGALRLVEVPAGFRVQYIWDPATQSIVASTADAAVYIGEGWFVGGDRYWLVPGTMPEDDGWLRHSTIRGPNMVRLISQVAPSWRQRGLPYDCDVRIDQSPALSVNVRQVLDDEIELDITWRVPAASVQYVPSLPGYVTASPTLMPGVTPQMLLHSLPATAGSIRLSGQQVPRFVRDTWPVIQGFAGGHIQDLLRRHSILHGHPELILAVSSQMRDGLGMVTAVPVVSLGDTRIDAADISRQFDAHTEYVRTDPGWLPNSSLATLGIGPLGCMNDGTPLEAIKLSPTEVLKRGSERLDGPWCRIEFPETRLPLGRSLSETTSLHVEFLRRWRIPGGIVSTSADVRRAFAESVASVVSEFPAAKVLVVGTKEALGSLDSVWSKYRGIRLDGLKKDPEVPSGFRGLVAASPRALETAPELLRTQWAIVCLLEADTLVRSDNSKLFTNLRGCRKSLVLGLFSGTDFLKRTPAREAISQIFHVNSYEAIELFEKYGLRDPAKQPPALPSPYQLRRRTRRQPEDASLAEISLSGRPAPGGLSIPQRPAFAPARGPEPRTDRLRFDIKIERHEIGHGYSTGQGKFVADARRLVALREKQAPFVPFMCYWPTYDAMTAAQRKWYFYWRGQVRDGHYIDTDLSYIFVHVYELLNNVGITSATDGYQQLWRLWMGYRERYPKLDFYLADWLTDYLLANRCGPEAMKALAEALSPGARIREPDLFLGYFLSASPLRMPVALIEALSDYRIGMSKFYLLDGNQDLLDKTLPQVLHRVNAHMLATTGVGVFDLFKPQTMETVRRDLFRSAVYDSLSTPLVTITVVPYSKHLPLRTFLTALVKHTENRLRELNGYEGRLRSYTLDPTIRAVVDEFLGFQAKVAPTPATMPRAGVQTVVPPPQVVIDMAEVLRLKKESVELQGLLLGGVETTGMADTEVPEATATPITVPQSAEQPHDPTHVRSDQDPIEEFLACLSNDEGCLVDTMAKCGWQVETSALRQALPGLLLEPVIERINELATELLGDILIAPEEDLLIVSDDLRDDLSRRLSALTPGDPQQVESERTPGDLPAKWAAFASRLAAHQRETLRALAELSDPVSAIRSIADRNATMPGLLIDSINELALDTVGDHIIVPGSNPPAIEDEDLEMVGRIVAAWATRPDRS